MNRLFITILALIGATTLQASPDPAYVKQQVAETIQGSMQNSNRFSQEEMQQLVNNANQNSRQFNDSARQSTQSANAYLKTDQARRDQQWLLQNQKDLENKKEYSQYKQTGVELCQNGQRFAEIECNKP
ncbi:hypothetical protein [Acinetobacter sp. DSM 11652]|uniref:hypothetical protein n=1 Tax=Acinetobacter sp. DSM 11652 TaxID=346222 RepID=UPI0008B67ABD|nr:hypothetical protein [Acinetobacter sp. DSM 11652]SEM30097.1 hypothetical protein SAMN05216500_1192 [Acinetobacter sp. DSM 11652]